MEYSTADLCDTHSDVLQILQPIMKSYGAKKRCEGVLETIELDEDNTTLVSYLKQPSKEKKIVVIDAKGKYCAIVGDTLLGYAKQNGFEGIIVNGYVRDIDITQHIDVALFALGTCPKKSTKKSQGHIGVDVSFGGVDFLSGFYLYADNDGIITTSKKLSL